MKQRHHNANCFILGCKCKYSFDNWPIELMKVVLKSISSLILEMKP